MATKRKAATRTASKLASATKSARAALLIAANPRRTVKERVAALAQAPLGITESDDNLQTVLNLLRDKQVPLPVRLAALQSLQAASFSFVVFQSCRSDYIATLREVAVDPDPEIRQRVLGILSREKDGFAQKRLLDGLSNPEKALVPPEKALQLLGNDVHAEAYAAARAIVSKPPNVSARYEALRLLAADAGSAPLFEKLLRDKNELREIRQISASALNAHRPEKFKVHARELLLDKTEYDDIQATCLTAIREFGDEKAIAEDAALLKGVEHLGNKASTKSSYKQSARRFLSKYSR